MLHQKRGMKGGAAGDTERQGPGARLSKSMACDVAFRLIALRCLDELTTTKQAACSGDPEAVHEMRIALTRLRTAILFFSPMLDNVKCAAIRRELKWLNSQLGAIRDLDVAIQRLEENKRHGSEASSYRAALWVRRRQKHRHLARALRSARYGRLIKSASEWTEDGQWARGPRKEAMRSSPVVEYGARKLLRWQRRLLKRSRKLLKMNMEKRHRLRLLNKKLTYSIEAFHDLFSDEHFLHHSAGLRYLRRAQKCLGQLNDEARGHTLATALQANGIRPYVPLISQKQEQRLLRNVVAAYRKLAKLSK